MKKMLNLVSPTRGEIYTLEDVLQKGLDRAALLVDEVKFIRENVHSNYNNKDSLFEIMNLHCSESQHTNSVNFRLDGLVPIHVTQSEGMEIGWNAQITKSDEINLKLTTWLTESLEEKEEIDLTEYILHGHNWGYKYSEEHFKWSEYKLLVKVLEKGILYHFLQKEAKSSIKETYDDSRRVNS